MKIYPWIKHTAISKIKYNEPNIVIIVAVITADLEKAVPNSPIRMCPVLRFAVNRTAKVTGRINVLINSIRHKKGFRAAGDPDG